MQSIFLPGLALLLSLTSTTLAQENQKPAQPLRDDSEFRALHNPVISADGAWMAAEERPDRCASQKLDPGQKHRSWHLLSRPYLTHPRLRLLSCLVTCI